MSINVQLSKKQIRDSLENLFVPDRTLDDTLDKCTCGGNPRTRYANGNVWIECISCSNHSKAASIFSEARASWEYLASRQL